MGRNIRDDFDKWTEQWAKAQEEGVFAKKEEQKITPQALADDFFGNHRPTNQTLKDVDGEYWNKIYRLSNNETLNEDKVPVTKQDNKTVSQITDDMGKLANSVPASTRGPDSKVRVTPDWTFGPNLDEIADMKVKLQKLEDKLAEDPMMEQKKTKTVLSQITDLKDKLDKLSNDLAPDFKSEYLS